MLVRARLLFDRDRQSSRAELPQTPAILGRLRYSPNPFQGRDGRGALTCLLMPEDPESIEPLVQLHHATITIDHRGIRIEGKEDEYKRTERRTYHQVLWCKLALPKPPAPQRPSVQLSSDVFGFVDDDDED